LDSAYSTGEVGGLALLEESMGGKGGQAVLLEESMVSCARYERSSKTMGSAVPPAAHRRNRLESLSA
jgi:hypothetical protein